MPSAVLAAYAPLAQFRSVRMATGELAAPHEKYTHSEQYYRHQKQKYSKQNYFHG